MQDKIHQNILKEQLKYATQNLQFLFTKEFQDNVNIGKEKASVYIFIIYFIYIYTIYTMIYKYTVYILFIV